jgi:hypothetical protein
LSSADAGVKTLAVFVVMGNRTPPGRTSPLPKRLPHIQQGHVEKIAAHAAAVIGRRQKGDIAAQGAQVAHMVGDALQFQSDGADDLGPGIRPVCREGLHGLGHAQAVADGRVTGDRFRR